MRRCNSRLRTAVRLPRSRRGWSKWATSRSGRIGRARSMKPESGAILANGTREQVELPCTVAEFVTAHGWKSTQVVIECNGHVLKRDELDRVMLGDGDQLEIIVPVAGG